MDLSDVAAGKQNDRCLSPVGGIGLEQDIGACCFCSTQSTGKICNFVTCRFASVGIREVSVGGEDCHLSEGRIDPYPVIGFIRPSDFNARRVPVVGSDLSPGE